MNSAKEYFNENDTTWVENPSLLPSPIPDFDESIAQYTGGDVRVSFWYD